MLRCWCVNAMNIYVHVLLSDEEIHVVAYYKVLQRSVIALHGAKHASKGNIDRSIYTFGSIILSSPINAVKDLHFLARRNSGGTGTCCRVVVSVDFAVHDILEFVADIAFAGSAFTPADTFFLVVRVLFLLLFRLQRQRRCQYEEDLFASLQWVNLRVEI